MDYYYSSTNATNIEQLLNYVDLTKPFYLKIEPSKYPEENQTRTQYTVSQEGQSDCFLEFNNEILNEDDNSFFSKALITISEIWNKEGDITMEEREVFSSILQDIFQGQEDAKLNELKQEKANKINNAKENKELSKKNKDTYVGLIQDAYSSKLFEDAANVLSIKDLVLSKIKTYISKRKIEAPYIDDLNKRKRAHKQNSSNNIM